MPKLKLSYFDFHGGRGEPIRLALAIGGIPFEDHRFPISDWPEMRDKTPFHQVPIMEIDGETLTQTNSISRYVGKQAGLYPEDPLEAARCDEAMSVIEDILSKIVVTFRIEDEDKKRLAREALAAGPISLYLQQLEAMLSNRGGNFFADNRLTVADLKVFIWVRNLKSGVLDYIPADIVNMVAPGLSEHHDRIASDPGVAAYYKSVGATGD